MSKYTTELRYICEDICGYTESQGYDKVDEIIDESRPKIFNFNYPIFDEAYRPTLETKIIKHYYLREIGTESVGVFKFLLNRKMNEIMPLYNQYYQSALLEFNPFYDMDYRIQHEGSNAGEHQDNEDNSFDLTNTLKDTGSSAIADTGTETNEKTGTETLKDTGTNTVNDTGTREVETDGATTLRDTGTKTVADTGTDTLVIDGTKEETTHEDTVVDASKSRTTTDKYNDTPQGGLSGIQSDAYLTNVRIIDESVSEDSDTDRDLESTIDNDETQTRTLNQQHQTTLNETHTTTEDTTETTTLNEQHQRTLNETHQTTYNVEDEKTLNTLHTKTLNETHTTTKAETHDINKSGSFSNTDEYVNHIFGKFQGMSYSKMLMEFRETFLNIDMMVINELNDLFMGVW